MKPAEIERLLPEVMRSSAREGPLALLLAVMAAQHAPTEHLLGDLDQFLDPMRADDRFVPLLARWVDLERLFAASALQSRGTPQREPISSGLGRLRELIRRAAVLSQWRGTRTGLVEFLETAVGIAGFRVLENPLDERGQPRAFHIHVVAPAAALPHRQLVERIIESEKPAYVTWHLTFDTGAST